MPGDPFKKARPGDPLQIPAQTYNAFIDTTRQFRAQQQGQRPGQSAAPLPSGVVWIRNDSGGNLDRFAVLGIDDVIIDPSDNPDVFAGRVALVGVEPTVEHFGADFAILIEPIADGAVGRAIVDGVTPVRLNIVNAAHNYADVTPAETELTSAPAGRLRLIYKQSGTGSGKYALGRFQSDLSFNAIITGATRDSDGTDDLPRWSYKVRPVGAKTLPGYAGWLEVASADELNAYNMAEFPNASATGDTAIGVAGGNLPDTFDFQAVPTGSIVRCWPVSVQDGTTEYWFNRSTVPDGTCE